MVNDWTAGYSINFPTTLKSGGTSVNSAAVDTLEFDIVDTDTPAGTVTINGWVEGTDVSTGNSVTDNTLDGNGAGFINVISPGGTLCISKTVLNTINLAENSVNTGRQLTIDFTMTTDLS